MSPHSGCARSQTSAGRSCSAQARRWRAPVLGWHSASRVSSALPRGAPGPLLPPSLLIVWASLSMTSAPTGRPRSSPLTAAASAPSTLRSRPDPGVAQARGPSRNDPDTKILKGGPSGHSTRVSLREDRGTVALPMTAPPRIVSGQPASLSRDPNDTLYHYRARVTAVHDGDTYVLCAHLARATPSRMQLRLRGFSREFLNDPGSWGGRAPSHEGPVVSRDARARTARRPERGACRPEPWA